MTVSCGQQCGGKLYYIAVFDIFYYIIYVIGWTIQLLNYIMIFGGPRDF